MADTPLFLLFALCLSRRLSRDALVEKHRAEGMAIKEEVGEKAGTRKMGIVVDLAKAEEMPRVTAAIVTVAGRKGGQLGSVNGRCTDGSRSTFYLSFEVQPESKRP